MKRFLIFIFIVCNLFSATYASTINVEKQLKYCARQVKRALKAEPSPDYRMQARNILSGDKQKKWNRRPACAEEWCSGFWPGILWMDYQFTHDEQIKREAERYTSSLRDIAYQPIYDHDIGFLMFCSFGKGYEVTHNAEYKKVILAAADSLSTLYNPRIGTILSWPRERKRNNWPHNTIMDNMINLDMLFWASKNGGSKKLYNIAVKHAETTMKYHFRPDGTCYHVAVYDTISGNFIKGVNHQGYADESTWARGQAWAVYGYTMVYRHTQDKKFLIFAQKVADAYLKRLSEKSKDWIPNWDFDDPDPNTSKDASAAAIVSDALLELCSYVEPQKGKEYKQAAMKMLENLSSKRYQSRNRNVAFLMHSTGHHPANSEIDASIIYADYYYLEALLRLKSMK